MRGAELSSARTGVPCWSADGEAVGVGAWPPEPAPAGPGVGAEVLSPDEDGAGVAVGPPEPVGVGAGDPPDGLEDGDGDCTGARAQQLRRAVNGHVTAGRLQQRACAEQLCGDAASGARARRPWLHRRAPPGSGQHGHAPITPACRSARRTGPAVVGASALALSAGAGALGLVGAGALGEDGAGASGLPGACAVELLDAGTSADAGGGALELLPPEGGCAAAPAGASADAGGSALPSATGLAGGANTAVMGLLSLLTATPRLRSTVSACGLTPPRPARLLSTTAVSKLTTTTSVSVMRGVRSYPYQPL
jgi:hypothetical protein